MFGFVIANNDIMSEEERQRYKSAYCGLCHSLKERHGQLSRFTLNYDMTFLVLVLNSLYEPTECNRCKRCLIHPVRKHDISSSEICDYAADMTVALSYLNLLDNWRDDKNLFSFFYSKLLNKRYECVAEMYPRQCGAMSRCVEELSAIEKAGEMVPDVGARLFGELMAEIFVMKEDRWSPTLRAMAMRLGEFIYIMDAVVDLEKDLKKSRYNPLAALNKDGRGNEFFHELLTVLIGGCTMEFEKLPLIDDVSLMRNILCSGVWTRYELEREKKTGKKEKHTDDI